MSEPPVKVIIIMGVSGSGKTTVGKLLSSNLGWQFEDGDSFHSADNIRKMRDGHPLTDEDRQPWLASMKKAVQNWIRDNKPCVLACSALKASYREELCIDAERVKVVFLNGSFNLMRERLLHRTNHYMKVGMLESQFETLEEPDDAVKLDASKKPQEIVEDVKAALGLTSVDVSQR